MRGLSDAFMNDLKVGILYPFLELVHEDDSLCLEIRGEAINIYFRGGSLICIARKPNGYEGFFDHNYLNLHKTQVTQLPQKLIGFIEISAWIAAIPNLKHEMGLWIARSHKYEREAQQLMVRENNFSGLANQTDYFICDIEYASPFGRYDLIAVHWPSTSQDRKNPDELDLAFIELKYGDDALTGSAGLSAHIRDIESYATPANLNALKSEMLRVFNQKHELGLIRAKHPIRSFSDRKPELLLALANHDPGSGILRRELRELVIPSNFPVDVKVATARFLGYGLFGGSVFSLDEFKTRFGEQA